MTGLVSDASVVLVGFSVGIYLSVMAVLFWKFVLEEPPVRRALAVPLFPMFCQNCGIPCAVLAFALGATDLAIVAFLLISLGVVSQDDDAAALNPTIELPLLISAITSFVLLTFLTLTG